jgi:hypothetical protein
MTLGGLPAAVRRWTKPVNILLVRLALSAHMNRVRRNRALPMRLMRPLRRIEVPELGSLGERPAKDRRRPPAPSV